MLDEITKRNCPRDLFEKNTSPTNEKIFEKVKFYADQGNAEAQYYLALIYFREKRNIEMTFQLLEKSGKQGYKKAKEATSNLHMKMEAACWDTVDV